MTTTSMPVPASELANQPCEISKITLTLQRILQKKSLIELSAKERNQYLDLMLIKNQRQLEPCSKGHVAKMLSVVAGMIGCSLPPSPVAAKYIEMLSVYPPDLVDEAGNDVLERHKWNTFPRVAEFIEPMKEMYNLRKQALRDIEKTMKFYGREMK